MIAMAARAQARKKESPDSRVVFALQELISSIPGSDEVTAAAPDARARKLIRGAAWKSAAVSGSLAIPPGPLGVLTILPDLMAVWQVQRQLVADIAAVYGKTALLTKEQMLYCLFRHGAGQLLRDLVTRVGERVLVKRASLRAMQVLLRQVGLRITTKKHAADGAAQ